MARRDDMWISGVGRGCDQEEHRSSGQSIAMGLVFE